MRLRDRMFVIVCAFPMLWLIPKHGKGYRAAVAIPPPDSLAGLRYLGTANIQRITPLIEVPGFRRKDRHQQHATIAMSAFRQH